MHKILFCLLLWGSFLPNTWADVNITTTIRPLQLIAETIVQDHGTVTAIIAANQSPHHYVMSPSNRLALAEADLLVWIGPTFETYLADFFVPLKDSRKLLTVSEDENLIRHDIVPGQLDAHLWLDSRNAVLIAESISRAASEQDSAHAAVFRENLNRFKASIDSLNIEIEAAVAASPRAGYAVYHNAYQYFEKQFGLEHQFALLRNPEVQPGIREIVAVRRRFAEEKPRCLLLEPDSNPDLVATAVAGQQLTTLTVDLLGHKVSSHQAATQSGYIELMKNVANDFVSCLY
ncbi:MAG: zinc ABC transporter substrate-binding protein [Pseudohongiella sp.]|jgi:zinc transport system substrate-binding protein|nr:zinc ABC transporter substrate-binding protein [Pseudohongiella sp.]